MTMQQQGDVILRRIEKLPEGIRLVPKGPRGHVLAEGERTGHAHVIAGGRVDMYEHNGTLYLDVHEPVELTHEEHAAQPLGPGVWQVGRILEYDYLKKAARPVRD